MTTFLCFMLVIHAHRQILKTTMTPKYSISKFTFSYILNHNLFSSKPTHPTISTKAILWLRWNRKFLESSILSESIVLLFPLHANPRSSTGVPQFSPLHSHYLNLCLFLSEHILAYSFNYQMSMSSLNLYSVSRACILQNQAHLLHAQTWFFFNVLLVNKSHLFSCTSKKSRRHFETTTRSCPFYTLFILQIYPLLSISSTQT